MRKTARALGATILLAALLFGIPIGLAGTIGNPLNSWAAIKAYNPDIAFAESTRRYIHSWIIRLLFRHPMEVQKTAGEYLALVRSAGFQVAPQSISYPYLWWSREDLGLMERVLRIKPNAVREETLINLVAVKPAV